MRLAYKAWDAAGQSVVDVIEASDANEAKENLRRRGLFVTEIDESNGSANANHSGETQGIKRKSKGARLKALSAFCRQLYVLVETGTPIVQALEAVERQTRDASMKLVIHDVRMNVEEGSSLSESMQSQPDYFDPVCRSLIAAGETAGKLPVMLDRVSAMSRKQVTVRNNVVGAMIYPCLLICISIGVLVLMLTFVLPRFGTLFEEQDLPLPPTTAVLMDLSLALRTQWHWFIGAILLLVVGTVVWVKSKSGKKTLDTVLLKVPFFGRLIRNFATARISRLMGILLDSYLPLLDVIGLVRDSMNNSNYKKLLDRAEEAVIHGEPMSKAFNDEMLINPSVYEAMRNGENSGQIAPLMLTISEFLDEENDVVVRSLTSILEPMILIVLGVLVGFVAISMFLPLFDLTASAGAH